MGTQPPIFISHSSAADADQEALLAAIRADLGPDFEILLDQDLLQAGDEWRHELYTWMALCAGAVIILSDGVLARPKWVRQELTILYWRRSLDPDFIVVPVLLPGLKLSDFDDLLEQALHKEIQMASGGNPAGISAQIRQALEPLRAKEPNPVARRIREIAGKLSRLTTQECQAAALKLDDHPLPWASHTTAQEGLARRMVHADFEKVCEVLIELGRRIGGDEACDILDWLFTYWVSPEAAATIPQVAVGQYRAVALNCTNASTGELYVRRAYCSYPSVPIQALITNDAAELPVEEIEKQLRDFFRQQDPKKSKGANDKLMQRYLETMGAEIKRQPIFVILDRPVLPENLVELQNRYPRFTFVLATGETLPAKSHYPSGRICLLEPPLESRLEDVHHIQRYETQAAIRINS